MNKIYKKNGEEISELKLNYDNGVQLQIYDIVGKINQLIKALSDKEEVKENPEQCKHGIYLVKNKPTTGDGFDYIYYCGECGLRETVSDNNNTPTPKEWEKELKEIINHDWELMDLNPGKPYRNGMKEVHFIKLRALLFHQKQELVDEINFHALNVARMTQQTIGDKNDYYVTLKQLEGLFEDM